MVSVFFAATVKAKARQTSTMTPMTFANPCDDRKIMKASSAYSMPTSHDDVVYSRLRYVVGFFRCTSSAKMTISPLNLWREAVSTVVKMLNNSRDSAHPCRSPCSTSNQSEQTSSGRTQVLILS